jgi:uncharacterized protein YciI
MNLPDSQLHVLFHSPGPRWQDGVGPREQEGIELHYAFVGRLAADGLVVLAGPFLDAENGGMVLTRIESGEEAQRRAEEDESVRSGLLAVRVRPWRVVTRDPD